MDLQRVAEHDEYNDGEATDRCSSSCGVHAHNIPPNIIAIAQIPSDTSQDIQRARTPYTRENDGSRTEMAVVSDLVQDAEHVLVARVREHDDGKGCECGDGTRPSEDAHRPALGECVAPDVVCDDEDDEVGDAE